MEKEKKKTEREREKIETEGYLKVQDIIPGRDLDHLHPISQLPEANT